MAPEDFVFCKEGGSTLNPDVLRRDVLYPTLDRLGIVRNRRAAGFHTFRHSAATIVNQKLETETRSEVAWALQPRHDGGCVHPHFRRRGSNC